MELLLYLGPIEPSDRKQVLEGGEDAGASACGRQKTDVSLSAFPVAAEYPTAAHLPTDAFLDMRGAQAEESDRPGLTSRPCHTTVL